tara:strand:+ start:163 stop:570 length:408 start_codon:yes stop_codon:yes gene_type:complete
MPELHELFNNKLSEFLKELVKTFPYDPDFKLFQASVRVLRLADEKKSLHLFNFGLTDEYKQNIRTKNEDFFMNNDYSDVLNNENLKKLNTDNDINNKLINKLKDYWKDLDDDNRNIVWQYFTVLLKICDKAYLLE